MEFEDAKPEYLKKLDNIREGNFISVTDFSARYGLIKGDDE